MTSITNCRNGVLTIEAPQSQIDAFLKYARAGGVHVAQSATKPAPLVPPEMIFPPLRKVGSGEDQNGRVRVLNEPAQALVNGVIRRDVPAPLPSYDIEYAPLKKVTGNQI